ncbi:MAG TPA: hypothetical protein PKZ84_10155 [Anaerolineae bacterium]|nr:hypothetical protein [Anaerolineae bacterium]HQI85003.1 hypothetical protein [Anaerolineae bacterium]
MADYCTVAEIKALAGTTLATDDVLLTVLATRASRIIDTYTGRVFGAVTATRYYTPGTDTVGKLLYLDDDLLSVTALTTNGVALAASAYTLLPLNTVHKNRVQLKSAYDWQYPDDPVGSIVLAGSWGYSATPPADVTQAAARLALWLYRQREAPFSRVGNAITGEYEVPVALPDDVRALLDAYRRVVWGAA